ncbi:hypothetical protein BSL78_02372 [Apostichopus japonicus]|uniref:RING finger protein n=1 Tax=Stichopus japonicus TaxID=307972 RepID=A0A2G8LKI7_STIJA|nr:hypothetical protein BSL78_02372 [Apostichopus japonicus]
MSKTESAFSFKKRGRLGKGRKRKTSDSDDDDSDNIIVKREKKVDYTNPNIQRTHKVAQRQKVANASSSDSEEEGKGVSLSYKSSRTAKPEGPDDGGATATVEIDTDLQQDAQAIFERNQKVNEELKGKEDDKLYRGVNNYHTYIEIKDTALGNASSGHVRKGPMRAPANIRSTTRWDYAPDICKDYKETGFCGFGDSCKFMHDRSDYKFGWQLEREWQSGSFSKVEDPSKYEIDSDEEDFPFKCFICRKHFTSPVVTRCKHYFCEKCALSHYKKSKRCFVCGQQTHGLFNVARELMAKLKRAKGDEEGKEGGNDGDSSEDSP